MPARSLEQLFPSMFQRRLVLLAALIALALVVLGGKVAHLTVVRGADLNAQAERRLIRHQWTPTVRGRILDRQGRVLARDRASYDVALDYPAITGDWCRENARRFVRSAYRELWGEWTEPQRQAMVERALPAYRELRERALDDLARLAGVARYVLDDQMRTVADAVERRHARWVELNRDQELKAAGERGEVVTPELLRAIERRVDQPIREMKIAHRVLSRLPDSAALELGLIRDDQTELTPIPGETGPRAADRVDRFPGLRIFDAGDREYPYDAQSVDVDFSSFPTPMRGRVKTTLALEGVASHLVGWMREDVFKEDNDARRAFLGSDPRAARAATLTTEDGLALDRGEYRDGDRVGSAGAEMGFEHRLRGLRGWATRQLDTESTTTIDPLPGADARLTIDIALQARVQAIMDPRAGLAVVQPWHRRADEPANPTMPDGTVIAGAAVVLDVDSGDILAMVSMPELTRREIRSSTASLAEDPVFVPFINRPIARGAPPGSIVKPLILCGAVKHSAYSLGQRIACNGHLLPEDENKYRCWIFKRSQNSGRYTHNGQLGHDLDASEALMVSCNIFFYTLGRRLGAGGIVDVYRDFGVGTPFSLGIGPEHVGTLGRAASSVGTPNIEPWDAIQMGIGQGPVTWTPLHAAAAYATLARYGVVIPPRLDVDRASAPSGDLGLDHSAVAQALEGLRRSANERLGTGHHLTINDQEEPIFNTPGIDVIGKTGTAAAPRIYSNPSPGDNPEPDADHDGVNDSPPRRPAPKELLREGDHSWFVVLAGSAGDSPRYAIAVIMEYAGSGGKVSGPIANQIIKALVAEGYLSPKPQ